MTSVKFVKCPTCQKEVAWEPASRWRPFCSERCRLVDLHGWFTEQHRIPAEAVTEEGGEFALTDDSSIESSPDDESQV